MAILRDPNGTNHEISYYGIQGLATRLVEKAINMNQTVRDDFQINFKEKITRFSPEFEFLIHRLGWMLQDPYCKGSEDYLISNGHRCYMAKKELVENPKFDRTKITNEAIGYPILTDDNVMYKPFPLETDDIGTGIIDEQGFVSSTCVRQNNNMLASIELMFEMIRNKDTYMNYTNPETKELYKDASSFLTARENVLATSKQPNGNIRLSFVSENTGKVKDLIDKLEIEGKIEKLGIVEGTTLSLMKK